MELYEINLSVDRVRSNEIYFQPGMVGIDQCGLIDAIRVLIDILNKKISLKSLSHQHSIKLLEDIYLIVINIFILLGRSCNNSWIKRENSIRFKERIRSLPIGKCECS